MARVGRHALTGSCLCGSADYIAPAFDYAHSGGRCSLTGGYVYRGGQGVVQPGTYLYGDYCTGEIFGWNGSSQSVLLASALSISSFGEDELGELYVVDLGGTVSRIVSSASCPFSISPARLTFARDGGTGMVAVTAGACAWTAESDASWITVTGSTLGTGDGAVTFSVAPYTGKPKNRNGTMTIAGQTFSVRQSK